MSSVTGKPRTDGDEGTDEICVSFIQGIGSVATYMLELKSELQKPFW